MQISLPRGELKDAVAGFIKIVNGRAHTLPILDCVRFVSYGSDCNLQLCRRTGSLPDNVG